MANKIYTVAYREGGPERFRWRQASVVFSTRAEAREFVQKLEAQGCPALIRQHDRKKWPFPPETFTHGQNVEDVEYLHGGWSRMKGSVNS